MYDDNKLFQESYNEKLIYEKSKKMFMMKKQLVQRLIILMADKYEQAKENKNSAMEMQREIDLDIRSNENDIVSARSLIKEHQKVVLETKLIFANEKASNIIKVPKKAINALLKGFAKKEKKSLFSIANIENKLEAINSDIENLDNSSLSEKSKESFMFLLRGKKYALEKQKSLVGKMATISDSVKKVMTKTKKVLSAGVIGYNNYFNKINEHVSNFNDQQGIMPETTIHALNKLLKEYDCSKKAIVHNEKKADKYKDIKNILSEMSMKYENNASLNARRNAEVVMSEMNAIEEETNNYISRLTKEKAEMNRIKNDTQTSESIDDILEEDSIIKEEAISNDLNGISLMDEIEKSINELDRLTNNKDFDKQEEKIENPVFSKPQERELKKAEGVEESYKLDENQGLDNASYDDKNLYGFSKPLFNKPINGFDIEFRPSELINKIDEDYKGKLRSESEMITPTIEEENPPIKTSLKVVPTRKRKNDESKSQLEERMSNLENQNKELLEELRKLRIAFNVKDHIDNDDTQKHSR